MAILKYIRRYRQKKRYEENLRKILAYIDYHNLR